MKRSHMEEEVEVRMMMMKRSHMEEEEEEEVRMRT